MSIWQIVAEIRRWWREVREPSGFSREWHASIERASWQADLPQFVRWRGDKVRQ